MSEIVKQIDSSDIDGVSHDLVGFVEPWPVHEVGGAMVDPYCGSVYRRPIRGQDQPIARCPHQHREIDAAAKCLVKLMRQHGKEAS